MSESKGGKTVKRLFWLCVGIGILAAGLGAQAGFRAMRKPPAQAEAKEIPLGVRVIEAQPQDIPVNLTGFGEVRCLSLVSIAPEVAGRVVSIHPKLEVGGVIPEGEVLFEIDARDYSARFEDAQAAAAMSRNTMERLKQQNQIDQDRLKTLERSRDLAQAEFKRIKELFETDQVGTRSAVEQAERAYNGTVDLVDQLKQSIELYPVRLREAENALTSAQARLEQAKINQERTVVKAPFAARVKMVSLETGQYVAPGVPVLSLADDSVLEISVPLDSREARQWLRFSAQSSEPDADAWFRSVESVPCDIRWTEDKDGHAWEGTLNRVEKFDEQTRTLTVAVRIAGAAARSKDAEMLPLVQGMFCQVNIPGRVIKGAYRLPNEAVTYQDNAYLSVESRLKTITVQKALVQGDDVIITEGLHPGDTVICTRLVNPMENALLAITTSEEGSAS